jgi:CheY-like chemotaxis protein
VSSSSTTNARNNTKIRILVVDDEPDILLTLDAVLSEQGHYVKTFDNPVEALSNLTSDNGVTPYDLVITDYRMPGSGMSGIDLAKRVKEFTQRKTKVFLMSGSVNAWSLPEEFAQALESKIVDEFIQKPIPSDKLIAVVEEEFLK